MIVDTLANASRYFSIHPLFKEAFEFLNRPCIASLPDGKVTLEEGGKLFANVQTYETKPLSEGKFEMHKKYIDLQFIVSGEEAIGYVPFSKGLTELTPYSDKTECSFYQGAPSLSKVSAGMFMLLFPGEPHMPCRALDKPCTVKKIVVKILAQ